MIVQYRANLLESLPYEVVRPSFSFLTEDETNMFTGEIEKKKNLYFQGCFIQADTLNHNQRIYTLKEITNAVDTIMKKIEDPHLGGPIISECDHPEELTINLDRSAGVILKMWMEGKNGMGRMKIINTPLGNIVRTLVQEKVRVGVSSRGVGNVDDRGYVSDFEIITIDIVANPSCKSAVPKPFFESINNNTMMLAEAVRHDPSAQKYLQKELLKEIRNLKF